MKPTSQRLSASSIGRYQAVVVALAESRPLSQRDLKRVGLLDRKNNDRLARLDLEEGSLLPDDDDAFDLIIVEQPKRATGHEPDFRLLKARLAADGAIILRRRSSFARLLGRFMSRRRSDSDGPTFGGGLDRREAALRRAGLYLAEVRLSVNRGHREPWLKASTAPANDTRYRDQIGRVATDYLRSAGPLVAGLGSQLPGL